MAITCSINGSAVTIDEGTLQISSVANGIDRLTVDVTSEDGSVRPLQDQVIIIEKDSVRKFGGYIDQPDEHGFGGVGLTPITTSVVAQCYNVLTTWRRVTGTFAAGTLKARLTALMAYLTPYGTTLDAAQVDGPTVVERVYADAELTVVFKDIELETGYVREIDYYNVLSMKAPGTVAAPFAVTEGGGYVKGDLRIVPNRAEYANRVIYRCGPSGTWVATQTWTAGGTEDAWVTDLPAAAPAPGSVLVGGVTKTIGAGANYTWDQATHTLTRGTDPRPGAGVVIVLVFTAQGPFTVQAPAASTEPTAEQTAHGLREHSEPKPEITTYAAAIASVTAELARRIASALRTAYYSTETDGLAVGQTQTINSPMRHVNASFLINEIQARDRGQVLRYDVTAVEGSRVQSTFRDTLDQWAGSSSTGSGVVISGGGGGSTTTLSGTSPLGGSRTRSRTIGTSSTPVEDWLPFRPTADMSVRLRVASRTRNGVTVTPELARYDSGTMSWVVTHTLSGVTGTTETEQELVAVLTAGELYRLQHHTNAADGDAYTIGQVEPV